MYFSVPGRTKVAENVVVKSDKLNVLMLQGEPESEKVFVRRNYFKDQKGHGNARKRYVGTIFIKIVVEHFITLKRRSLPTYFF